VAEPFVRIQHPQVDGEATIALSAVPGHAARGWVIVGPVDGPSSAPAAPPSLTKPAANASTDAWRTYAVAASVLGAAGGLTYEQAMASSRDELAARFADLPDVPDPSDTSADASADALDPQES
jgi:hypothetical protein